MYLTHDQLNDFIDVFNTLSLLSKQDIVNFYKDQYDNLVSRQAFIDYELAKARGVREQLAPDDIGKIDEMDETIDEFETELNRLIDGIGIACEKITAMETIIALEQKESV